MGYLHFPAIFTEVAIADVAIIPIRAILFTLIADLNARVLTKWSAVRTLTANFSAIAKTLSL